MKRERVLTFVPSEELRCFQLISCDIFGSAIKELDDPAVDPEDLVICLLRLGLEFKVAFKSFPRGR